MNGIRGTEPKLDCVVMPFEKAGRYRLIFRFARIPHGQTLIALLCNDRSVPSFEFVPLSKTAIVDVTITGDKPFLLPPILRSCRSRWPVPHTILFPGFLWKLYGATGQEIAEVGADH